MDKFYFYSMFMVSLFSFCNLGVAEDVAISPGNYIITARHSGKALAAVAHIWEIQNQSDYSFRIVYRGPTNGSMTVPSKGTKTASLPAGLYSISGYSFKANVSPYSGTIRLESGWRYRNAFYISTIPYLGLPK